MAVQNWESAVARCRQTSGSFLSILLPGFSEPIGPVQSVQFGINPLEKTLDFRALVGTRVFFKAAEEVLLLRQQLSNARHRRRNIVMLQHW
jgi:hypothetical protein